MFWRFGQQIKILHVPCVRNYKKKKCHINDFKVITEKIASFVSYQGYKSKWFYTNK